MCYGMRCRYEQTDGECTLGAGPFPLDAACRVGDEDPRLNCQECPYEVTGGDCQGECVKEME